MSEVTPDIVPTKASTGPKRKLKFHLDLQPKQMQAYDFLQPGMRPTTVGLGGARGGGKSHMGRHWIISMLMQYENVVGYVFRRTMDDLQDNHIIPMHMEMPWTVRYWREQKKMLVLPGNRRLRFISGENPKDVFRLAGKEAAFIFVDQAEQFTQEELEFIRTLNRWTKNRLVHAKMLWTFNPGGIGAQYLKRVMVQRKFEGNEVAEDFAFVDAKGWDNVEWLRPYLDQKGLTAEDFYGWSDEERFKKFIEFTDYGKNLNTLPDDMRQAHLFGDWDTFAGQFFHEWRHQLHVRKGRLKEFPEPVMVAGAIDYGRRTCMHVGFRTENGYVEIFDECWTEDLSPSQRAHKCADMIEKWALWKLMVLYDTNMDISLKNYYGGDKRPIDYFREVFKERFAEDKQPILIPVSKRSPDNRNYRAIANEAVREFLKVTKTESGAQLGPMVRVWENCEKLIGTLPELQYPAHGKGDGLDFDQSIGIDDAFDAFKYLLLYLQVGWQAASERPIVDEDDYILRVVVPRIMKKQHNGNTYGRIHADTI